MGATGQTSSVLKPIAVYQIVTWIAALLIVGAAVLVGKGDHSITYIGVGLAMWAPAIGRLVATRTVDRSFRSPIPLRLRDLSLWSVGVPLVVEFMIYSAAVTAALALGLARWAPRTTDPLLFARNLGFALITLPFTGLVVSLGEELGWRGYLQPRLAGRVPLPALWVGLLWWSFHFPAVLLGGYQESPSPWLTQPMFAVSCVADSLLWGWASTRKRSLWPALWFHCLHNFLSQGIFPSLVAADVRWVGEDGLFPTVSHLLATAALWLLWVRRSTPSPAPRPAG